MGPVVLVGFLFFFISSSQAFPDEIRSNFELLGYSTNLDNPQYRILDNVRPTYMYVDLDVYLIQSSFDGFVRMNIEVRENLTQIVVHQNVVAISAVNVVNAQNRPVALQVPVPFEIDSYYEILKINFAETIPVGNYIISISYRGQINQNPLDRGFYKGYYFVGNELRQYATTQFQPYHARKAFPCFDEPQFKCPFVISITRDGNLSPSYSNMPIAETQSLSGNRIRETFHPTPVISAYLIAFHVSDFVETNLTGSYARPFGIVSRQGVTNQHQYAADIGFKITEALNEYFDIDYYDMGQGNPMKNDHIALPDFPSGAMENWGMVNYREAYLLYDPQHTNLNNKVFIAAIMAHELAHKWFGNLVTCFWWSNLWINESYATLYQYFGVHYADPSLEMDEQFVVDQVHSGLNSDAFPSATPMNWTAVANNPSISSHFSPTSYAKGGSVLRMMENFIGFTNFRNGLRYYLKENAYGIGYPEDVYNGLRKAVAEDPTFASDFPGIDIGSVLDTWVQNPGAPVLTVNINTGTGEITVTQERFQLTGNIPNSLWHIPITWTHGESPNFSNTRPSFVLTERSTVIQGPAETWVIFNIAQSGHYRVNYDDGNWARIAATLRTERNIVHKLNRAQIVNDVLYFIRAQRISVERGLDVLSFLKDETDYYVWAGALGQLDWVRRRLEHLPSAFDQFNAFLLELMENVIQNLGYDDRPTDSTSTILNRMQIMNFACNLGHSGCTNDSQEKWNRFKEDPTYLVPVNARRYVYCTGLRNGNASDYEFLFQKYNTSENTADMVVILRTLACTRDQASFENYLLQSMHNSRIRIHDRTNAFLFALQGNRENFRTVLNFLHQQFNNIRQHYGGDARLSIAVNDLTAFLTNFEDITAFQSWLYLNQIALRDTFNIGVNVINNSIENLTWGNRAAPDVFGFLRARGSAASVTSSLVLIIVVIAGHFFTS